VTRELGDVDAEFDALMARELSAVKRQPARAGRTAQVTGSLIIDASC
jgi:hypothetical protein